MRIKCYCQSAASMWKEEVYAHMASLCKLSSRADSLHSKLWSQTWWLRLLQVRIMHKWNLQNKEDLDVVMQKLIEESEKAGRWTQGHLACAVKKARHILDLTFWVFLGPGSPSTAAPQTTLQTARFRAAALTQFTLRFCRYCHLTSTALLHEFNT